MSVLNSQIVAEVMRHRMGDADASHSARYVFLIPSALKATARKIAANPDLRNLLMTDKTVTTATLDANSSVILDSLYSAFKILHEFLDVGEIYLEGEPYPLQWITRQRAALPQYLGNAYRYCYLDGRRLVVKDAPEGALVSFSVPKYPAQLANLPTSEEVQTIFFDKLTEIFTGGDSAEDGDH